jgi:hypothetical protein
MGTVQKVPGLARNFGGHGITVRANPAQGKLMYQPQQQQRAIGAFRLVGMPYDGETVDPAPEPTLETHEPVDALYHRLLDQFIPVEEPPAATASELAEAEYEAKYREHIHQAYGRLGVPFNDEIKSGIRHACASRGFPPSRDRCLRQDIDFIIWKSILKYKGRMNGKLAFTIAKFETSNFLNKQRSEQTRPVTTMVPVLDESGEPVLNRNGEPKQKRVPMLDEFGKKRVYNQSFDDRGVDEEGVNKTSRAEREVAMGALRPEVADPNLDKLARGLPLLQALVSAWMPGSAKRLVGENLLKYPDATVREFPGVSKSNAGRVLKVVKEEFRKILEKVGQN